MADDIATLTGSEALHRIRAGELSVEELARACLARIDERDPLVRAWTHIDAGLVLANARELDRCESKGPLHGLPIGIKDVILTHDMPTQFNSPIYRGFHPTMDASCVSVLRAAGALILGKTDTVEFASNARRALTRNPHDLGRTPGGSSSGSGAAVADCHVPLALGTQTGGSIIRPASFCGVYGMKPTWGIVSRDGSKTYSATLDTIGWFGRCADDLALLYDVFDRSAKRPPPLNLAKARVAVCLSPVWHHADVATANALAHAVERLRTVGAQVVELDLPAPFERLIDCQVLIMRAEAQASFLPEYATALERLHPTLREQVENVDGYTREALCEAYDTAASCRMVFDKLAKPFDFILTPSAIGEATLGLASTGEPLFSAMWTLLHAPCINVPGFTGPNGLPVGLTITGPRFSDCRLLAAADALGSLFAGMTD